MLTELGVAARRLLQDRWSAVAAVVVAALGSGLNTAVFAIAYGVLIRPLPYRDPSRLAVIDVSVPFTRIDDWRGQLSAFERVTAYTQGGGFTVRGLGEPNFVRVAVVDDRFFQTLDTAAVAGRTFVPGDSPAVAILSERVARQAGVSIETVVGRSIIVGETTVTVIGIMPEAFAFPTPGTAVWIPARAVPAIAFDRSPDERRFRLLGRLNRHATLQQASEEIVRVRRTLDPEFNAHPVPIRVESLYDALVRPARPVLLAFSAAAAVVLLIACANIATILVGRTVARQRELAIRSALGASRARLFVTIISESILIAVAGAALGAVLGVVAVRVIAAWAAGILPRLSDVRVDWSTLAFALGIAALSSIIAVAPALRSIELAALTARIGIGGTPRRVRVRALLAVSQIALAVVLLSAGGLLTRTIVGLLRADIGLEPRGVIVSQWMLTSAINFEATGRERWMQNVLVRIRAIPGVIAAGAGSSLPPDNAAIVVTARFVNGANVIDTPELTLASVTPGYLEALGTRLRQGRFFEQADERRSDFVTVLSESAARMLMHDVNPVGRPLPIDLPGVRGRARPTVLGVVADVKYSGLEFAAGPAIYVLWKELPAGQIYLALRIRGDAPAVAPMLRALLREADSAMPVMPIRTLDEVVQRSVADRRLRALLGGSVALLAVAIAIVGVAGGLGRMVSERRRELAIRAALGATPYRALSMVMVDATIITAAGLGVGMMATLAASDVLRSLVFGISPHDPLTLLLVAVSVSMGSLSACYLPARRAAATNPLDMLRDE